MQTTKSVQQNDVELLYAFGTSFICIKLRCRLSIYIYIVLGAIRHAQWVTDIRIDAEKIPGYMRRPTRDRKTSQT